MKRSAFVLCVVLALSGALFAQGWSESGPKTVTNVDLEKFRQQRLAGEREYREKYAELGFPSPEELSAQIERERELKFHLSEQLRQERLESEKIDIERGRVAIDALRLQSEIDARNDDRSRESESTYFGGYNGYGGYYGYPSYGGYGIRYRGFGIYVPRYGRQGSRYIPNPRYIPWGVYRGGRQYRPRFTPPFR